MSNLKQLIGLLMILVMGWGCAAPVIASEIEPVVVPEAETRVVQEEPQVLLNIQGRVIDGNTLQSVKNVTVEIVIKYREARRWKKVFKKTQTTDGQGHYIFKDILGDFLNQKQYTVDFILKCDKYLASRYLHRVTDNAFNLNLDFGLIKPTDKLILKGRVVDVVNDTSLPNVKMRVKRYRRPKSGVERPEPIYCQTDRNGNYRTELMSEYFRYSLEKNNYYQVGVESEVYEVVISEYHCGEEGRQPDQKIADMINFTQWIQDFALVDVQKEGGMTGKLVDADGQPLTEVPLTIQFGRRKG